MKPHQYKPPSYLDPKEILTPQEESELHQEMTRFGANVFKHRVLIKPYFQDKVIVLWGNCDLILNKG